MNIVIFGLSITSSWGNGHATTYRALVRALAGRGHDVVFFERDVPWYAENRDLPAPPYGRTVVYGDVDELHDVAHDAVRRADLTIVGSFVPDGVAVGEWVLDRAGGVRAFYDIDTPVTLQQLRNGGAPYLATQQVPRYDLYLSFSGGPVLASLESEFGAQRARPLYCSVDAEQYRPDATPPRWHLGYLGTYSPDRQPALEARLLEPARRWADGRFIVAGPQFPEELEWPRNVDRVQHLPPCEHRDFYCSQRFTLNVTRSAMVNAGHSPSVRLFEAAACGTPIITDQWEGLEQFFEPGKEILVSTSAEETLEYLRWLPEPARVKVGERARARVLAHHTADHRADELESLCMEAVA